MNATTMCLANGDGAVRFYCSSSKYRIYKCLSCNFGFVWPRPEINERLDFYNSSHAFNYSPKALSKKQATSLVLKNVSTIRKYAPHAKSLLDVGCSYGHELFGYRELGYSVRGVDYSKEAVEYCIKKYCVVASIGSWPSDAEVYDVIISRHVFEHVLVISEFVENLSKFLASNGVGYIITPNFNSLTSKLFRGYWNAITPPGHLNYWTDSSLSQLFESYGFKVLHTHTTSFSYSEAPARGIPGFWIGLIESVINLLNIRSSSVSACRNPVVKYGNSANSSGVTLPGGKLRYLKNSVYFFAWTLNFFFIPFQLLIDKLGLGEELHIVFKRKN